MASAVVEYSYDRVLQVDQLPAEELGETATSATERAIAVRPGRSALVAAVELAVLLIAAACGGAWLMHWWVQQQPAPLDSSGPSLTWFASASLTLLQFHYSLLDWQLYPERPRDAKQLPAHSLTLVNSSTCRAPSFPAGRCLLCNQPSTPDVTRHDNAADMTMTHNIGGPLALLPPYLLLVHEEAGMDYHGLLLTSSALWRLPRSCGPDGALRLAASPTYVHFANSSSERPPLPAPTHVVDHAIVLAQYQSEEYYHMMIENLPRLTLLPPALLESGSEVPIVIVAPRYDTQLELFDWLQLRHRLLLLPSTGSWVQARQALLVPSHSGCGMPNPRTLQALRHMLHERSGWMADTMPDMFTAHSAPAVRRVLWIQRFNGTRSVTNDAELLGDLTAALPDAELTFHRSDARLSMREVAQLYYNADLIVGPHGAGLSNLLFTRPGTAVIEFLPTRRVILCFQYLAGVLSLEHIRIMASSRSPDSPMTVSRAALAEALAYIANRSAAQRSAVQRTLAGVADNMCEG